MAKKWNFTRFSFYDVFTLCRLLDHHLLSITHAFIRDIALMLLWVTCTTPLVWRNRIFLSRRLQSPLEGPVTLPSVSLLWKTLLMWLTANFHQTVALMESTSLRSMGNFLWVFLALSNQAVLLYLGQGFEGMLGIKSKCIIVGIYTNTFYHVLQCEMHAAV